MAHPAVAVLESALRAHKLDRTLTTALPAWGRAEASTLAPVEVAAVDACLRGGLPRGQLSELAGSCTSGQMSLLLQVMAAATRRGEIAAFVDTFDRLDVASAVAAGMDLDRLLWIRGRAVTSGQGLASPAGTGHRLEALGGGGLSGVGCALKALNLVLQAGGFGVVAMDVTEVSPAGLRQIPYTTWPRIQRVIDGSDTACVLLTREPLARSAGGLTLALAARSTWTTGASGRSRRLRGLEVRVRVVSPRQQIDGDVAVSAVANDGGPFDSSWSAIEGRVGA